MGLISIAIALPVTLFMQSCFALANDSGSADSWLSWTGWRRLVFGFNAHRRWHYTREQPPMRYVRWFIRSSSESPLETLFNACASLKATLTCSEPHWVVHARAVEDAAALASADEHDASESAARDARRLARHQRWLTCVGVLGTYTIWALFVWCVLRVACRCSIERPSDAPPGSPVRFIFTYGMRPRCVTCVHRV